MSRCTGIWAIPSPYGEYLRLDLLLGAQRPLTAEHSEMLFIIVHQVSERGCVCCGMSWSA